MSAKLIVEQRLKESSEQDPTSIYDVGFDSVVNEASKNFLIEGWDATVRKVALLEKTASHHNDEFAMGQQAAVELLTNISEEEFLGILEGESEMSFELGKEAAYADFVELAEDGAGFTEVMGLVSETLAAELEKNASEEDVDFRMGIDAACHQFMKVANEIYGEYDLEDMSDEEILDFALMKIAKDERTKEEVAAKLRERYGYKGSMGGVGKREGAKKKMVAEATERNLGSRARKGRDPLLNPRVHTDSAAGPSLGSRLSSAVDRARYTAKNLSRNEKIGVGAGAAGLAAAGLGAGYMLNRRRKANQEQEKSASDYRIQEALEILAEAGLLDD